MYKEFYHMNTDPFGTLPQPDVFFDSKTHKEAWDYLLFGIESQEPFLLITGDYGMGKTMLCLRLIQNAEELIDRLFVYIPAPNYQYAAILAALAQRLALPQQYEDESSQQSLLYHYVSTQKTNSAYYIVIDDAQEMEVITLRKLQLLTNVNHNGFFPFRLILFAHTAFLDQLASPELRALDQRIRRRCRLSRFDFYETKQYIYFRLYKADAPGIPTFTDDAIRTIVSLSDGVPRLINNVCDACLMAGAARKLTVIDDSVVREAVKTVDKETAEEQVRTEEFTVGSDHEPPVTALSQQEDGGEKPAELPSSALRKNRTAAQRVFSVLPLILIMLVGVLVATVYMQYRIITADKKAPAVSPAQKEAAALQKKNGDALKPPQAADTTTSVQVEQTIPVITSTSSSLEQVLTSDSTDAITKTASIPVEQPKTPGVTTAVPEIMSYDTTTSSSSTTVIPITTITLPENVTEYPYTIQFSCNRSLEGAQTDMVTLQKKGLSPYRVRVNFKDRGWWWVVYSGYYQSQSEALKDKELYKLTDALIVKTPYANLIGSYSTEDEMQDMLSRLKQSGYHPYVIPTERGLLRLYVGGFTTKKEAEDLNQKLAAEGFSSTVENR
jgi:type II secretory pathway predicted ATPase ExeA/cell division protein FtsN